MAKGPFIWGPNSQSINLQNQAIQASGNQLVYNGAQNLIGFNNFENGLTTGFSLGTTGTLTNGIPTGTPTFGSGASGNLALGLNTSTPINGLNSLFLTSIAASTVGNMVATDTLAVSSGNQAKVLTFKFNYSLGAGSVGVNFSGTSSNSFGIACYDVTNSAWLPVAGNFAMTQSSGVGIATGTMQTASNTASVRFVIYNVTATGGAFGISFDDFFLGPQTAPIGPVVTDPIAYTPTFTGFGTPTNVNATYSRRGKFLRVDFRLGTGTVTAAVASMTLPPGLTIDQFSAGTQIVGTMGNNSAVADCWVVSQLSVSTSLLYFAKITNGGLAIQNGNTSPFGNSQIQTGYFEVPITGWSSNVQSSNDTDTRVVCASYYRTTTLSIPNTTSTAVPFDVLEKDTHGAYNTSTGVFTVPVSGLYSINCIIAYAANGVGARSIRIFKNGSLYQVSQASPNSGQIVDVTCNVVLSLSAGDTIQIQTIQDSGGALNLYSDSNKLSFLSIFRLSGPAVIAATDSVNARYNNSATVITSSPATIVWTNKDFDSTGSMSSAGYTVPVSGKYLVIASVFTGSTKVAGQGTGMQIQKNGVDVSAAQNNITAASSIGLSTKIMDVVQCNAGDVIRIQAQDSGTTPVITSNAQNNYIDIVRVGN